MERKYKGIGPRKGDTEGANQPNAAAGGSGPRGAGIAKSNRNPDQWGAAGTSTQPETAGGRKGKEEPVVTSLDRERFDDEF